MKALVIGAGRMGSGFDRLKEKKWINTHIGAYKKNHEITEIALSDSNPVRLKTEGEYWRIANTYPDVGVALADFSPEIVSLCTPPSANLDLIRQIVRFPSVRKVWIEKPFSDTEKSARSQIGLLERHKIAFATNYQRRFDCSYRYIKDRMTELIGAPLKSVAFFSGGIINTASHLVNTLIYFFGVPNAAKALSIRKDDAGIYHGDFFARFGSLPSYMFEVHELSSILKGGYSIFEIQIIGENGKLILRSLPFNGIDFSYERAGKSRFPNVRILNRASLAIPVKRDYMETGLRELIKRHYRKNADREGALETLSVFKKIGVIKK